MEALDCRWSEHKHDIERAIDAVSAHYRFSVEDREDFASEVKVRFFDKTKSPLLRHEGRASWATYLRVVIVNLALDFANKRWGRWRPSAAARRFGDLGIRLERLLERDRVDLEVAVETVIHESGGELTRSQVFQVYSHLPLRLRPELVDLELVVEPSSGATASDGFWEAQHESEVREAVAAAIAAIDQLDPEDARIMRLRYLDGFTLARIGEEVGLPLQRVHDRIGRSRRKLREMLDGDAGGVDLATVS